MTGKSIVTAIVQEKQRLAAPDGRTGKLRHILSVIALLLGCWIMAFGYGVSALAQVVPPLAHDQPTSISDLTFGQVMVLLSNFGIGGLVFFIWLYDMKRQTGLEQLNTRYSESSAAHLQAFKDINEAYRELASETNKATLLNVQVQTRLAEKLEAMERAHGK